MSRRYSLSESCLNISKKIYICRYIDLLAKRWVLSLSRLNCIFSDIKFCLAVRPRGIHFQY